MRFSLSKKTDILWPSLLITALYPQYLSGTMSHPPSSVAPVSPVPAIGVELPPAVFDDVSWMRVEQMFLQQFCAQCSRVQRQCGGCALWL